MPKILLSIAFLTFLWPGISLAQLSGQLVGSGLSIDVEPTHPKPGATVTARLNDFSLGQSNATIEWFADGSRIPESTNKRSIELTAGEMGEVLELTVTLTPNQGGAIRASRSIVPSAVDIIVEPQTFTPSFYAGRGLPSSYSEVSLTAIAHSNAANLSYVWRVNNQTIGGGPQMNNSVTFTTPLGREMTVIVDVLDSSGTIIARNAVSLPIANPELLFYEVNALKGLVELPLSNNFQLIGNETTIAAAPYYLSNDLLNEEQPLVEWSIDGVVQSVDPTDPYQISIIRNGVFEGSSELSLHIRNLSNLLQGASDSILMRY